MRLPVPVPPILASLAGAALIVLLVFGIANQAPSRTLDEALAQGRHPVAPDAAMRLPALSNDGGRRSLAAYRGQVVVLDFWASWCTVCQAEAATLKHLQRRLAPQHATMLGVTYQDTAPDSLEFIHAHHIAYPNLRDPNGEFVHAFGTEQLPESFLINRRGRIVDIVRGPVDAAFLHRAVALAEGR